MKSHVLRKCFASLVVAGIFTALPAAAAEKHGIFCVGDSITEGMGASDAEHTYPAQLAALLGADYEMTNFGAGGTTLLESGNFPYSTTTAYTAATHDVGDRPGLVDVIIQLGTNDSKPTNWTPSNKTAFLPECEAFVDHYATMASKPRVWLNTEPPALKNDYDIDGSVIRNEIDPLIKQCAQNKHVGLIDVDAAFASLPNLAAYLSDGVHPNDMGYSLLAHTVFQALPKDPPSTSGSGGSDPTGSTGGSDPTGSTGGSDPTGSTGGSRPGAGSSGGGCSAARTDGAHGLWWAIGLAIACSPFVRRGSRRR